MTTIRQRVERLKEFMSKQNPRNGHKAGYKKGYLTALNDVLLVID